VRIAVVHSFYRGVSPSGENTLVQRQVDALRARGHEVLLLRRDSGRVPAPIEAVQAAVVVASGAGPSPLDALRRFHPDVTHVHNLFPQFSDRWLARAPSPLVVSLHNFRLVCAAAILFRDGARCTECIDSSPLSGVRHSCYRDSRAATLPLTIAQLRRHNGASLLDTADAVTVPSERTLQQFRAFGVDTSRFTVLPAGVDVTLTDPVHPSLTSQWLAAGRLSPEKGFRELVQQWPRGVGLTIRGDGPQREELARVARAGITVEPATTPARHRADLRRYTGFVFPSLWQETQGLAALESLASGVPVIARADTAVADTVFDINPRWVYRDSRELGLAISAVTESGMSARQRALDHVRRTGTTEVWLDALESLYARTIRDSHGH
jgi:glycosyltransferase involved in cell wall biosynthesis